MKLSNITAVLEQIAPVALAESWDNVGLLAGDYEQPVRKIMLAIDLTAAVWAEARQKKIDLIVAYHPPIWEPLKKVVAGAGYTPSALLHEVIRANVGIYALHTALDVAAGGVNDLLAEIVGIDAPLPLQRRAEGGSDMCKLVVFVPPGDLPRVSEALFEAGAGHIGAAGKYSKCSFRVEGAGTFQCGPESNPTIGRPGSFEQVSELRLETIVPVGQLDAAVRALRGAHSYEEPAFDVYPLLESQPQQGIGRYGTLKQPTTTVVLLEKIKKALKAPTVGVIGPARRTVRSAAVAAGSAGSLLGEVIRHKCDFYLTGELSHHRALELARAGVTTVCVGHSVSERVVLPRLAGRLRRECFETEVLISRKDRDPFTWC